MQKKTSQVYDFWLGKSNGGTQDAPTGVSRRFRCSLTALKDSVRLLNDFWWARYCLQVHCRGETIAHPTFSTLIQYFEINHRENKWHVSQGVSWLESTCDSETTRGLVWIRSQGTHSVVSLRVTIQWFKIMTKTIVFEVWKTTYFFWSSLNAFLCRRSLNHRFVTCRGTPACASWLRQRSNPRVILDNIHFPISTYALYRM